jgi:hypothetical protein
MTTTTRTRTYATPVGLQRAHITDTDFASPMITALCGQRLSLYGVTFGPRPVASAQWLCSRCRRRDDYEQRERGNDDALHRPGG